MGRTEKQLADLISKQLKLPVRKGRQFVQLLLEKVQEDLIKTERSELRGLGVFGLEDRPARKTHHPKTGEPIEIPARKAIRFRASRSLKDAINKPKGKDAPGGKGKSQAEPAET